MTKYYDERHKYDSKDTVISLPNYKDETKSYYCENCKHLLSTLRNSTNTSYFCRQCSTIVSPDIESLQPVSKILQPEGPYAAGSNPLSTPLPERMLRRRGGKSPKGVMKNLQERGMKITKYEERGWRKETYDS